jgi:hypothetical protein
VRLFSHNCPIRTSGAISQSLATQHYLTVIVLFLLFRYSWTYLWTTYHLLKPTITQAASHTIIGPMLATIKTPAARVMQTITLPNPKSYTLLT